MYAFPSPHEQVGNRSGSDANQIQVPGLTAKGDPRQFVKHNYTDHSHEEGDVNYAKRYNLECYEHDNTQEGGDGTSSEQQPVTQILQSPTFPLKLHMILDEIEDSNSNMKNAISWLPHGRAFHIRNGDIFKREVLAKYFKNCKISSFYRQINLYGFIRLTTGCETGAYYHEYFLRGKAFLTKNIVRTKKGTKIRPTSAPKNEPNFYGMAPICSMQQSISTPLELGPSSGQGENSIALLAAMQEVERINYANVESQNYRCIPQNTIQSAFLGGIVSPHASVDHPLPLSLFNSNGYLADDLRSQYNQMPRTINQDMMRAAAVRNELSRTALHNEMSQVAAHTEMARAVVHNELSRAAVHNEMTRAAMQNELSRNVHNEMPVMAHHAEVQHTLHDEIQRIIPTSTLTASNSPHQTEELEMIAEMLRASNRHIF